MLTLQLITTQTEWDNALLSLPNAHTLQSWDWGAFKSRWGWTAHRLLWTESGKPVAAAQILRRPLLRSPWCFLYVSKGPIYDYANVQLGNSLLTELETYARRARALFIKIDPDIIRQFGEPSESRLNLPEGNQMLALLARRGWQFSPEQIQFRNTVMVDLTPTEDELLARLKSKWRYNIRLAQRKGVTIRRGTTADIPAFYRIYAATAARDGFLIRPEAYYADVWQHFMAANQAEMLLAEVENKIISGLILFIFGNKAWYLYGASTTTHRNLMPNHLLQWSAMQQAKARGCTCYDMWGAPDVFDEADRLWGVYRFKQGFGGQVMQGLGAYDYPVNRPAYWAFTVMLPQLRALMRRFKK